MHSSVTLDLKLLALLAAALAVTQGLAWLLARGLGARLERSAVALGLLLPVLLLAPWLVYVSGMLNPKRATRSSGVLRSSIRRIEPSGITSASGASSSRL